QDGRLRARQTAWVGQASILIRVIDETSCLPGGQLGILSLETHGSRRYEDVELPINVTGIPPLRVQVYARAFGLFPFSNGELVADYHEQLLDSDPATAPILFDDETVSIAGSFRMRSSSGRRVLGFGLPPTTFDTLARFGSLIWRWLLKSAMLEESVDGAV